MKKTIAIVLALVLAMTFAFALVACNNNPADKPETPDKPDTPDTPDKPDTPDTPDTPATKYTITFVDNGGGEIAPITAAAGEEITAPVDPVKEGFIFAGWFESTDGGKTFADKAFAFAYMPGKNITLYAKWDAVTEVGKKYAVKNYKTDVIFAFDDPSKVPEDLEENQKLHSTMWLLFKENHAVEIYLHPEMEKDFRYYGINSGNAVEFFETAEDAEKLTNKLTGDYYDWSYVFDSSRKTLTVSTRVEDKMTLTMILTVVE